MATGATRDDAALRTGLARWVTAHPEVVRGLAGAEGGSGGGSGEVQLLGLARAQGGQANETVLVDLGPAHPGMVVRLPPLEPTFPDYDLGPQALVQNAVAASGVPAPGAGGVRHRSRVDRLVLPGHAACGGRHPRAGALLRSLRA